MKSSRNGVPESGSSAGQGSIRFEVDLAAALSQIRERVQERLRALVNGTSAAEAHPKEGLRGRALSADVPPGLNNAAPQEPSHHAQVFEQLFARVPSDRLAVSLDELIDNAVVCLTGLISSGAPDSTRSITQPGTLTTRQQAVLRLVAQGLSNKQIARSLNITVPTVKTHLFWAMEKLGAENRTQAAVQAFHRGLL